MTNHANERQLGAIADAVDSVRWRVAHNDTNVNITQAKLNAMDAIRAYLSDSTAGSTDIATSLAVYGGYLDALAGNDR